MPMPAILQALGLCSSAGNNSMLEDSPNSCNMYLNLLQQGSDSQAQMANEWSAPYTGAHLKTHKAQLASHYGSQLLDVDVDNRLMRAEADIFTLKDSCRKLDLLLEQYELINQELATQVIALQTKLKTP